MTSIRNRQNAPVAAAMIATVLSMVVVSPADAARNCAPEREICYGVPCPPCPPPGVQPRSATEEYREGLEKFRDDLEKAREKNRVSKDEYARGIDDYRGGIAAYRQKGLND